MSPDVGVYRRESETTVETSDGPEFERPNDGAIDGTTTRYRGAAR